MGDAQPVDGLNCEKTANETLNLSDSKDILQEYRALLGLFRRENGKVRRLPVIPFYWFGMEARRKLIYQVGALKYALIGEIL